MCMRFINENDRVLEIGGNIGRTTHIIQTILNNPSNHVVMECDTNVAKQLQYNLTLNKFTSIHIETAALSKSKLALINGNPRPIDPNMITPETNIMPTISFSEIQDKYNIKFNVLVADCEGSLYYIITEDPDLLNNIETIILENDFETLEHKVAVDNVFLSKGFKCIYEEKGVPAAAWCCCFDNFYQVWKKF